MVSQVFEDKLTNGLWPEQRLVFAKTRPGSLIVKTLIRDGDAGYFQVKEKEVILIIHDYQHLLLLSTAAPRPLTLGTFTVNTILGWDEDRGIV